LLGYQGIVQAVAAAVVVVPAVALVASAAVELAVFSVLPPPVVTGHQIRVAAVVDMAAVVAAPAVALVGLVLLFWLYQQLTIQPIQPVPRLYLLTQLQRLYPLQHLDRIQLNI
jgi:hypothetical protein